MSHFSQSMYKSIVYASLAILLASLTACKSNTNKLSTPVSTESQSAPAPTGTSPASDMKTQAKTNSTELTEAPAKPPSQPAATTDESYQTIVDNKFYTADRQPLSTFSIDVDTASYSNVRRFINEGQLPPKDAVRIEEMVNYFAYDYPQPVGDKPFSINTEVATAPWNPQHKLVQIGLQGKKIGMEKLPPK